MKDTAPKFGFYEKVRIASADESLSDELGAVLGRSQGDKGVWHYSIHVYSLGTCISLAEEYLVTTGEFAERQDFYDDSSLRVYVDKEARGHLADGQDN